MLELVPSMRGESLVKVENVSKKFCRNLKKSLWYGVKDIGSELVGRNNHQADLRNKEFWALQDINFELKRGEVLGFIGRNGAGKTTLLKILNGLIKPDTGKVTMRGRVGALIALGAGFNPILTGRENIYVNGAVLGLSKKEIDEKFDEIVDFAELWDFIDTPVQSYSSGMHVRLGFAVASNLEPEILLIDEILAVGDRAFRLKCFNHISKIISNTAVILVSHNMFNISQVCNRVIIVDKGSIIFNGDVQNGISMYNKSTDYDSAERLIHTAKGITLNRFEILDKEITWGEKLHLILDFDSEKEINETYLRFIATGIDGNVIAEWRSGYHGLFYDINKGNNKINVCIEDLRLRIDKYNVNLVLTKGSGSEYLITAHQAESFSVVDGLYTSSNYVI